MSLVVDEESSIDLNEIIKSFYLRITATTKALEQDGHENPVDLTFELIVPHMDWIFCTLYAYWSAQMCPIDVLEIDPKSFNTDHPNHVETTLKAFLQHTREKGAKWSIKITEKALQHVNG